MDQLTVMVVDDHPMWREAVSRDLAEAGFAVVATAGTGRRRCGGLGPPGRRWWCWI
ncbi:hypothetical protein CFP65_1908 [Kitasatospora sp. MMS16-BH015]|nr:hypothetical protein CFP65_1908 [Kitasatospora sp. MMS16-BH015]